MRMLLAWWQAWRTRKSGWLAERRQAALASALKRRAIGDAMWQDTVGSLPFVASLPPEDISHLRLLSSLFLDGKEFSGAAGLQITDAQAVMVAAQACLPLVHMAPRDRPDLVLAWYDGFVGIVLQPGEVRARREWVDEDGIAHSASEDLTGEILEGGPLMLAWSDVQAAAETAKEAYNVVIHEFIHVMDLRDGHADGCPPMPSDKRREWLTVMQAEYERFVQESELWERFGSLQEGSEQPLLDAYGRTGIDEFFPVAAEAYFTQREAFALRHPALLRVFDGFFKPG